MPELSPEENAALRRACSAIRDGADVPDHFKDFLKELGVTSFPKPSSNGSAKPPPASDPEPAPMDDDSDFESDPSTTVAKALTVELWHRAGAFASSVAVAMTPPSGVGKAKGKFIDGELPDRIAYIAREVPPDAPTGDRVEVILTALRCTPLCLAAPAGTFGEKEATDHVIDIIAAGMGCGERDVEAAARRALRRHCDALSGKSLRRAVQLTLRAAEEAMEGSTDPTEWACRFKTAAAIVAEASRRTADDLYFDKDVHFSQISSQQLIAPAPSASPAARRGVRGSAHRD